MHSVELALGVLLAAIDLQSMAGNPLRLPMPGDREPEPLRSRFGSFPMQPPGPDEFTRLQDLLAQALKREAEAHRKMKHLYEQLLEAQSRSPRTRSISDGKRACNRSLSCG